MPISSLRSLWPAPLRDAEPRAGSRTGALDVIATAALDPEFREQVRIDKIQLLYRQSSHGVLGSLMGGIFWAAIIWQYPAEVDRATLALWLLVHAFASALRLGLFMVYRRVQPEGSAVLRWTGPYVATLVFASLVWGVGTLLVVPADSTLLMVVTYVFIIGLAGAAGVAYGVFSEMAVFVIVLVLFPIVAVLVALGSWMMTLLAIAGLWFFLVTMRGLAVHNRAMDESFRLAHELRDATLAAEELAQTDGLTSLKNRRAFTDAANALLAVATRERQDASMLLIDVDGFKELNDRFGHATGDDALARIAQIITMQLRRSDLCGRLGGDEFAVLLPHTTLDAARVVAEKLCTAVASQSFTPEPSSGAITLSIGLASGRDDCGALLQQADSAMYEAKRLGKNRVAAHAANAANTANAARAPRRRNETASPGDGTPA